MEADPELQKIVEMLNTSATVTREVARQLAVDLEVARKLAAADRVQISRLLVLVGRLLEAVQSNSEGTLRLEHTAANVAEDLAASITRADEAPSETPGAGADAALRSPGTAAEREQRL